MSAFKKDGIIYIEGEFDIYHAHEIRTSIVDFYEESKKDIILDLTDVTFMDSTGLGVLISILKDIEDEGHKISIINTPSKIKKIFKITELDKIFNMGD